MADNRTTRRWNKRVSLKFGIDKIEKVGFSDDLSYDGLFIRTAVTARLGVIILIEIEQPDGLIAMHAEVRWTKKVPARYLHKLKGGMGVKITSFTSGEDLYYALCDDMVNSRGG